MNLIRQYKWQIMITTLVVVVVFVFVYVQFLHYKNHYQNIRISIQGDIPFIVENDVRNMISNHGKYAVMGVAIRYVNLKAIEKKIKQDPWVQDAHVYRDVQNILHVDIVQKQPAMRVFTIEGKSFYLDQKGNRIPLSLYSVANVPICTGYPLYFSENKDKIFVAEVLDLLTLVGQDDYLKNCMSYIHVLDTMSVEIIPKTGTPIVRMKLQDSKEKILNEIKNFYLQVIPNVGWDYYSYIDLRFENEIIALKKQV